MLCVFIASSQLVGVAEDPLNPSVKTIPYNIPVVPYKPFRIKSTFHVTESLGETELLLQYATPSQTVYASGEQLVAVFNATLRIEKKPTDIPFRSNWDEQFQMKFRNGAWYYRLSDIIKRIDPNTGSQATVLTPKRHFSQFEVSPYGQLILIGTGLPQPKIPGHHYRDPLSYCIENTIEFASIYFEYDETPAKSISLPDDFEFTQRQVGNIKGPGRSFWMGDTLLIHSPELGRIWTMELAEWQLKELVVPWASLNRELVEKNKIKTAKNIFNHTSVQISRDLFPETFEFWPSDESTAVLVVQWARITKEQALASMREIRAFGLCSDSIEIKPRESTTKFYELDVVNARIKALDNQTELRHKLKAVGPQHLIRYDGLAIPIPTYHAPAAETAGAAPAGGLTPP